MRLCVEHGANVKLADTADTTSLHVACEMVRDQRHGCWSGAGSQRSGRRPARHHYSPRAQWPRRRGATAGTKARRSTGRRRADGLRRCTSACENGHVDVARLLLDNGAEVNRAKKDGATPLYIACEKGHVDAARLLLDKGADMNRAKENGVTPLFIACFNNHVDVARLLLEQGADVDRAKEDGATPLYVASCQAPGHRRRGAGPHVPAAHKGRGR